jgi:phenylpyruvate tautomerase PptA (4-oxalocrotonate tautomerase family)
MPYLAVRTNQAVEPDQIGPLLRKLTKTVADGLGKSEDYVMVSIHDASPMLFAGSDAPLAYLELKSIGMPKERTTALSASLCALVGERLNVPQDRIYIEFADAQRYMWGWNGGTF